MMKILVAALMLLVSTEAYAAGSGISSWAKYSGSIADGDFFAMTDISDTSMSSSGTNKAATALQVKSYLGSNLEFLMGSLDDLKVITTAEPVDGENLVTASPSDKTKQTYTAAQSDTLLALKQAVLESGTSIKTINNTSLLGSGNITVSAAADDTAYNATSWDSDTNAPTKNAVRDKIVSMDATIAGISAGNFAFDTFPTYEDSAHTTGIAVNSNTLAVYSATAGKWLTASLTDSLDPTPLTIASTTIGATGLSASLLASQAVTFGAGGNGGVSLNCSSSGAITATYSSGGTTSTLVYGLSPTILKGETCTYAYTQPTNGIEAVANGLDLATIGSTSAVNNSNQYRLTVTSPDHGTITTSDADLSASINCGTGGAACTATAADGSALTGITATADSGYSFTSWSGGVSGAYNAGQLDLTTNTTIGANFSAVASGSVGDSTIEATTQSMGANYLYMYRRQASKSGSLSTAYVYDAASHTDANIKICIYNSANSIPAQVADTDTLIGCTGEINSNNANEWLSSSITGSVVSGNYYWITVLTNTAGQSWNLKRGSSETLWYKASAGLYASPPADLDGITMSNGALAPFSAYIVIP